MIWAIAVGAVAGLLLIGALMAVVAKMPPSKGGGGHDSPDGAWSWTGGDGGSCDHGGGHDGGCH